MNMCCIVAKQEARLLSPAIRFMASHLAQKMFLAYLDGAISTATVGEISVAVQGHSTHAAIADWVRQKVQEFVKETGTFPMEIQLRDICSNAIDTFTMLSPGPAMAEAPVSVGGRAYFSGSLQAVIGGINDITLSDSKIVSKSPTEMRFRAAYTIRDFYDFDNDRTMFPAYDKYRKDLTKLYATSCTSFMGKFHSDMTSAPNSGGDAKKGPLDKAQIFTCFMYALELNRCTSSLLWDAEIPFEATVQAQSVSPVPDHPSPVPPVPDLPLPPVPKRRPVPKPKPPLPVPPTPVLPVGPGTAYVVKAGDNLSKIAKQHYGDERLWPRIYEANRAIIGKNPNLIHPGQKLEIPK
jgi:hypothetical protein